jgi:hypothetical protein
MVLLLSTASFGKHSFMDLVHANQEATDNIRVLPGKRV